MCKQKRSVIIGWIRRDRSVSLKEISERQNLSLKYLEQIVTPLLYQLSYTPIYIR